jgi:osmotically-inducible protein OsmY
MADDRRMQQMVEAALGGIPAPNLRVRVKNGVVHLGGTVVSDAARARAEKLSGQVEGVRSIVNDLVVDPLAGNEALPDGAEAAYDVAPEALEEIALGEGLEADLNQPAGTTDPLRPEVLEGEPYFPPTDPVIEPMGEWEGGYRVLGGYSESSMDRPHSPEPPPARLWGGDDQIADDVRLALKEDAATTDLNIHVHVRDGVAFLHGRVPYLEDVEAAEEVAGRVRGVREVREQLIVE